jgi:single-strand DNA-binding protein
MEKSINKVELRGYAGMDHEVKTLNDGRVLMKFSLVTTTNYRTRSDEWERETIWHNVVLWNKLADRALLHIRKGSFVKITGKILTRYYTDRRGVRHYVTEVIGFNFEVMETEKNVPAVNAA